MSLNRFGNNESNAPQCEEYVSALGRAIATWRQGFAIPMDLATELMADGYDVPALEARHLNN